MKIWWGTQSTLAQCLTDSRGSGKVSSPFALTEAERETRGDRNWADFNISLHPAVSKNISLQSLPFIQAALTLSLILSWPKEQVERDVLPICALIQKRTTVENTNSNVLKGYTGKKLFPWFHFLMHVN